MLSWWTNMESIAALNNWMLTATLIFAGLTGIMVFLTTGKSRNLVCRLSEDLEASRKRIKSLEKTAEEIRKELLQTQQHQDINQLKLKTSNTSAVELRQALLNARKRLEIAEAAIKTHQEQAEQDGDGTEAIETSPLPTYTMPLPPEQDGDGTEAIETLDLELEAEGCLSESQREQLIDLLDPGPKGNVDIFCVMGDKESELTAKELEEVLTADGWKTNDVAQSAFSNPPKGLVLAVHSKDTAPSYASFLQRVFSTIGMTVSAKTDNKYREWSLTIIVGTIDG
ncbi:MAG: hypothetical protein HGJ93_02985 [Desulfosarcina sp.]|nr:hypothetical protein [Desulfosarcina sp.]MBC2764938.1 hypothetical protein [Desulfosarcina sp.]